MYFLTKITPPWQAFFDCLSRISSVRGCWKQVSRYVVDSSGELKPISVSGFRVFRIRY